MSIYYIGTSSRKCRDASKFHRDSGNGRGRDEEEAARSHDGYYDHANQLSRTYPRRPRLEGGESFHEIAGYLLQRETDDASDV